MIIEGFEISEDKLPRHVGIIMDGNFRWAKNFSLTSFDGHRKGVEALKKILIFAYDVLHLDIISLYVFSIENWKRTREEVGFLMDLFINFYQTDFKEITDRKVRVVHSGIRDNLSKGIIKALDSMKEETKDHKNGTINLAFNYGGRNEIISAIKEYSKDIIDGKKNIDDLTEDVFSNYLFNPDLPDPDLIIRTSGELRLSNFLIWQSAYSELYFTDTLWPDFSPKELTKAIYEYQQRERRFGGR